MMSLEGRGNQTGFIKACEGYGAIPAKYMFVGISAGRHGALLTRVPFTKDSSGRLMQRALKFLGLATSDEFSLKPVLVNCYITNLVKGRCLTLDGLNRLPTAEEFAYWFRDFMEEYEKVKPTRLIAVGRIVADQIWQRWPRRESAGLFELYGRLAIVNHPRYFASHGALGSGISKAFLDMTWQYRLAMI